MIKKICVCFVHRCFFLLTIVLSVLRILITPLVSSNFWWSQFALYISVHHVWLFLINVCYCLANCLMCMTVRLKFSSTRLNGHHNWFIVTQCLPHMIIMICFQCPNLSLTLLHRLRHIPYTQLRIISEEKQSG